MSQQIDDDIIISSSPLCVGDHELEMYYHHLLAGGRKRSRNRRECMMDGETALRVKPHKGEDDERHIHARIESLTLHLQAALRQSGRRRHGCPSLPSGLRPAAIIDGCCLLLYNKEKIRGEG